MINTIQHKQYPELCELLGENGAKDWCRLAFTDGEFTVSEWDEYIWLDGVPSKGAYHYGVVRRVHFDLDYTNYVLAQVWDHNADPQVWEFVLFYNSARNGWVPEQMYSWGTTCPSYAEAGAIVDEIEFLRYNV